MEQMYCDKLVKDYKNNCEFAASVAVNHVANMEIPVFNTMSSLSKSELLDCFYKTTKIVQNSPMNEQILFYTIFMEALTGAMKHPDFYHSFDRNNESFLRLLCRKISDFDKFTIKEDMDIIQLNIELMAKYAKNIYSPALNHCLHFMQERISLRKTVACANNSLISKTKEVNGVIDSKKNGIKSFLTQSEVNFDKISTKDSNKDVENNLEQTNNVKRILFDYANQVEHIIKVNLDEKSKKNDENMNIENINTNLGKKRMSNAFDIMMMASKAKNKKK